MTWCDLYWQYVILIMYYETKVGTNVIFHDHEEVLFQIYDFQMTWCDLYWQYVILIMY